MFENERALFVGVALEAGSVRPCRKSRLLQLDPSVRIMAIAAIHRAFEHLMMEWPVELRLGLVVTRHAELNRVFFQHTLRGEVTGVRSKGSDWLQRRRTVTIWLDL